MFMHPFSCIIAGPSGCGKSQFVTRFIQNKESLCSVQFKKIFWHYDSWQPLYKEMGSDIIFRQGLPDLDFEGTEPNLIIIDDLMRESDGRVVDIFTKGSHHRNLSVFFITQNLFNQGKGQRDISLNAHYIVLFKNPRDKAQIQHLARQVAPENPKFLREAYTDATLKPHGYLLLDLKQETPEEFRFCTNILLHERPINVYIPKKGYKYDDHSDYSFNRV